MSQPNKWCLKLPKYVVKWDKRLQQNTVKNSLPEWETKNIHDNWREVIRAWGKRIRGLRHPHPEDLANDLVGKWSKEASLNGLPQETRQARTIGGKAREETIIRALKRGALTCTEITREEILQFIIKGRYTAPGEDGITYKILNCLASISDGPMIHLFNMGFMEGKLARAWKSTIIIPLSIPRGGFKPICSGWLS